MTRREFVAAGAASWLLAHHGALADSRPNARANSCSPEIPADHRHSHVDSTNMTIREYLSDQARRITDRALTDYKDAAAFHRLVPERRHQFLEMMGLADLPPIDQRPPLDVQVTGVIERPGYRIEKLHYQSLPGLYVTANLYVPAPNAQRPTPNAGVLYVCGHADKQKVHYQAHPRRFAELGFVALLVETVQLGEAAGFHHGCYREGWWHWYSRGYSPASVELLNGMRGLDLLAARPEVDPSRLGVTGISGGGASTWWIAAGDERIKAAAPVCGTATLESHIYDRTIDGHCDCMWWPNLYGWDLADVGGLIAPRPLLIASADRDAIFTIASIRKVHEQLHGLYHKLGAAERIRLVETPGPHSYHERSRTAIFSWFARHLQGREIPAESIGDVDERPERQESEDTLRVFTAGAPARNRATAIQDELIRLAEPPKIAGLASLQKERNRVVEVLRRTAFQAFPSAPPALDLKVEYEEAESGAMGGRFAFTAEEGWRLHGQYRPAPGGGRAPAIVALRSPGEPWRAAESMLGEVQVPWIRVVVEPRGTGDTAWGEELNWHLRRAAAWTGRTIASMRVWDTLRALEAVRHLPGVEPNEVWLAAAEEMTVVALYGALVDGRVAGLFLNAPPTTQNAPSRPDGRGPATEMLGCLRVTDLPQVAGLLCPTRIVIAGVAPDAYAGAQQTYSDLGHGSAFQRVSSFQVWNPGQQRSQ